MKEFATYLPEFPRTRHLPHNPNAQRDDLIASTAEAAIIFNSPNVYCEEKIDAANFGMNIVDDQPILRNRNHILRKGYGGRTAAKQQFAPAWNWFYEHRDKIEALHGLFDLNVGIYGEWMYAQHTVAYDNLPSLFIPYDIYDWDEGYFVDTGVVRERLAQVGLPMTPLLHKGAVPSYEYLDELCHQPSAFSTTGAMREGVYIKVCDGQKVVARFKMVRNDFICGQHWSKNQLTKNKVGKS